MGILVVGAPSINSLPRRIAPQNMEYTSSSSLYSTEKDSIEYSIEESEGRKRKEREREPSCWYIPHFTCQLGDIKHSARGLISTFIYVGGTASLYGAIVYSFTSPYALMRSLYTMLSRSLYLPATMHNTRRYIYTYMNV